MDEQITYLVTGCSRGIGAAITHRLLDMEHQVIGISRNLPDFSPENFTHITADLSDLRSPRG